MGAAKESGKRGLGVNNPACAAYISQLPDRTPHGPGLSFRIEPNLESVLRRCSGFVDAEYAVLTALDLLQRQIFEGLHRDPGLTPWATP